MNRSICFVLSLSLLLLCSTTVPAKEKHSRVKQTVVGEVSFNPTGLKPDRHGQRELEAVVKKLRSLGGSRTLKIQGDFSGAKDEKDYLTKTAFMSEAAAQWLSEHLPVDYQLLIAAGSFRKTNRTHSRNTVTIYLMPSKLEIKKVDHERLPAEYLMVHERKEVTVSPSEEPSLPVKTPIVEQAPAVVNKEPEPAVKKVTEEDRLAAERELKEAVRRANELVAKEKERAAERERQLKNSEQGITPPPGSQSEQ